MSPSRSKQPSSAPPLYQLKITLRWSKPPIWRRVVVPGNMRLSRFHRVIQVAMGWDDSHLHQFAVKSGHAVTFYAQRDPAFGEQPPGTEEEHNYTVADLAPSARSKFMYEYDFGDGWLHEIVVEKMLPPDPAFKHPVCLEGKGACPPDDSGGIPGYYDKLQILADPKHPDHEFIKEWMGENFDPDAFDLEKVNRTLQKIRLTG